jgi:hypothetical protein
MKELEQKALDLIDKHLPNVRGADSYNYNLDDMNVFLSKQHSIESVNYALEVLNNVLPYVYFNNEEAVKSVINEQIELKKILEGRV